MLYKTSASESFTVITYGNKKKNALVIVLAAEVFLFLWFK